MGESVLTERQDSPAVDSATAAAPVTPASAAAAPERVPVIAGATPSELRPSRWQPLPYSIVLAGVLAGLGWVWIGSHQLKVGMAIAACAFIAGAVARLVLPERQAGLLASRDRVIDFLALACFGTCIFTLALVLPNPT
jgi:hypothetical protein